MKCLVTGATGFVGRALSDRLESRGASVERCGREAPTAEQLGGALAVFHCAGIAHRAASWEDYETYNYRASLELARRSREAGVGRFIFLSSVIAADPADAYGHWKQRTERELLVSHRKADMNVIVVRPALVYGVGVRGNLERLVRLVQRGMPTPPPGQARSMVGLADLCDVLCLLTEIDPGRGRVFTVTDGESYDLRRLHRAFSIALGREPGPARWPQWCWWLACACYDSLRLQPLAGRTYQRLFRGQTFPNGELCETLSWQPRQCLEDVASDIVEEMTG